MTSRPIGRRFTGALLTTLAASLLLSAAWWLADGSVAPWWATTTAGTTAALPVLFGRPAYRARSDCRSTVTYWLRYALAEPRDLAYAAPRRLACRLLGRHNATCRGRTDHPRTRPAR
ncbi:hypothetical protein [Streptomyces sp. C10-9-1]|uniref:hypothetical protein n=1 Tax=Streptomyces sp. C10-9-1 TaxID=1859285 RepID=UPI003F49BB73